MSWSDERTLAGATGPSRMGIYERGSELPRGSIVDRYVVTSLLGSGGMGVVYAAYDPELDRRVALKFLHRQGPDQRAGRARRLLREAQALAKLAHPNVVTVYDVGTYGDDVWLAMEFIDGKTLRAWVAQRPPGTWSEILDVCVAAARGLAAAHGAGLVHRDVKPDNVMLGDDGRVRVMDFGLARGSGPDSSSDPTQGVAASHPLQEPLTEAGALLGTPVYMPPEQMRREPVDALADQFSWCVMAWEALYGRRPYKGETAAEVVASVTKGAAKIPPNAPEVPGWIYDVLLRGLAPDPGERWPSLDHLLEALDRRRAGTRRRRIALAGVAVAAVAVAAYGGYRLDVEHRSVACAEQGASLQATWNDAARNEVRAALVATGIPHAATTADKVLPRMDAYAESWAAATTEVCRQAEVEGAWPEPVVDAAHWCLEARRAEFVALFEQLVEADAEATHRAGSGAAGLPLLDTCVDRGTLERLPSPPQGDRDEVQAVRNELSRASILRTTGHAEQALDTSRDALRRAELIGWEPLVAEAHLGLGTVLADLSRLDEAEPELEAAFFTADASGATESAFTAARLLAAAVGRLGARRVDGERWIRHAHNRLAALHDPDGLRQADLWSTMALMRVTHGDYADAVALHEKVIAIRQKALGPRHPLVGEAVSNLGGALYDTGEQGRGAKLYEQALEMAVEAHGERHPAVARALSNLGRVHHGRREFDEALALFEKALEIQRAAYGEESAEVAKMLRAIGTVHFLRGDLDEAERLLTRALPMTERELGADHPQVAMALNDLANVAGRQDRDVEAIRLRERALAILEAKMGADHPDVAFTLNNLGTVYKATGQYLDAGAALGRALQIWERAYGAEHPYIAAAKFNLGEIKRKLGEPTQAQRLYRETLKLWEKTLGIDHPDLAYPLVGLSELALEAGRAAEAADLAERAVNLREDGRASKGELGDALLALAQALDEVEDGSSRATAFAERARDAFREAGEGATQRLDNAETWLADRR